MHRMAVSLLFLLSLEVSALGRVVDYESVFAHLSASIQSVETCGRWQKDGEIGDFRVIRLFVYGQDMIFVDLVKPNRNGSEFEVVRGYTFSEINDDHAEIEISDWSCNEIGENEITLMLTTRSVFDPEPKRVRIGISADSETYTYERIETFSN